MSGPVSKPGESFLVFAGMRNEGAFLVEWLCWYLMLGFDVLVGINDCTDHSPALLRRLQQEGLLRVFEHSPQGGEPPKISAHRAMRKQPEVARADWLLICDVDEFVVLHAGDGTIGGYLDAVGRDVGGIAFHWKCFGNSGWKQYQDGLVHRQFRRCGPPGNRVNAMFKMLVRAPMRFARFSDHSPYRFDGDWQAPENRMVDCEGRVIERFLTDPHPIRFTLPEEITHATAQMNHYVIRSDEGFDLKRGKPSASANKDRYTERFYQARNKNGHKDESALAFRDRFDRVHARVMALPGVQLLHTLCCIDYVERLCAGKGTDPQADPRWLALVAQADALAG